MNNFNTHDYDFLIKTLQQGSLIFKAEALKRLLMLAINDKKQFAIITKQVLDYLPQYYLEDKQDINMNATMLLSQIIINSASKQIQNSISQGHIEHIIRNLGHESKPNIRKSSHTCLLSFLKNFKNFSSLCKSYVQFGFNNQSPLIQQKSINSFQSILILQLKKFNWEANQSKTLFENIILKISDQNPNVSKAASQCLLSACKISDAKFLISKLSIGFLSKLKGFLEQALQSNNPSLFQITPDDVQQLINGKKKPVQQERNTIQVPPIIQTIEQKDFQTIKVNNTQRRLDKIRKSIKTNQPKKSIANQKQVISIKLLGNPSFQGSIKQKTQAVQDLLFKIQANKEKPQFQVALKQILPQLTKLLKDSNPKIVGTTLRILQITIQNINSNDKNFNALLSVIVQKLGDQKISIRQTVSKVIRQLIKKTKKGIWIQELLQNMKKNTNTFLRDQTLSLIHYIFEQNQLQDIDYPLSDLLDSIVIYSDDPKTKIKIRTLDCLSQIVFVSKQVQKYNQLLKGKIPAIFYQMYIEKLNRLLKQNEKKNVQEEKAKRVQNFASTYRSAYSQRNKVDKNQSQNDDEDDEDKLNVSVQLVKKRISLLKKPRNLMSTQQASSVDNHSQRTIERTIDRTIQDVQVILPSLYKKTTTNHFISRAHSKKTDYSPNKTAEKISQYLSKDELQPLKDPERQFKQILNDLKSADWKVLFQSTNKLRQIIQFNPEIIKKSHSTSIHSLVLEILALIQNLRSSVSKNGLICLNQLLLVLERQIDPELQIVFEKLIKKSADTNVFISAEVQKCLNHLGLCASPYKFLQKVSQYKDSKSVPIKDACVSSLLYLKQDDSIRQKQYIKLAQSFSYFLTDGQQQIRNKAKLGIVQLCNSLTDWYRALRGKINPSFFKSICQLMTKSNSILRDNQQRHQTIKNSPKKRQLVSKDEYSTIKSQKSSSIRQTPLKIQLVQQPKKKAAKVSQFPSQFEQIQGYLQICNSSDWKKRMDSLNKVKNLALAHQNQFMQFRSANHFIDSLSKQILEPNLKISVNAMQIFQQIRFPLKLLIQNNLGILCNSFFNVLSSNKSQVKQKAQVCTKNLINETEIQIILQHLCHGIMYSLPKSRIYLLNILKEKVEGIHQNRKPLLFKYVFPLMNKLMDQYKSELIPHVVNIFYKLYDVMGNHMFSHLTKFKQVRELIDK